MRLDVAPNREYLDVNKHMGEIYIVEKMDRELFCMSKPFTTCAFELDVTIENPVPC